MNKKLNIKKINFLIFFCLLLQFLIYIYNNNKTNLNFYKKDTSIENFSSIILTKSGITKIGSQKLNKISDVTLYLEGSSYLENKNYEIIGSNITINIDAESSYSNSPVKTINSMGEMNAKGFKNNDLEGKIFFIGSAVFKFD